MRGGRRQRAVIIGGGLGGLALALRLAARGMAVTVCERSGRLGGKMNRLERDGFSFDTGPSLITMPHVFEGLFASVGETLSDHLELMPVRPLAEYVYPDGTRFAHGGALPDWIDTLRRLEPRDVDGFFRYVRLGARMFALSESTFLRRPLGAPPDRAALAAMARMPWRHAWGNYARAVGAHFKSPYLVQLYNRYPTYVGSSPYEAPAMLAVIPYLEYAFGGWHVSGGLYRIVEALTALGAARGVTFRTDAEVTRIRVANGRVAGVGLAGGEELDADVCVMNGDPSMAPALLGGAAGSTLRPRDRSLSGLVFLVGLNRRVEGWGHHTVFFSEDYPREFGSLFRERRFPEDPTVYVNMPTRSDPRLAPPGCETLFIMANAPPDAEEAWDAAATAKAREQVFARLRAGGFPDLDDAAVEEVWTPGDFAERYAMPGGAIYGAHSHGWRRAFFRPPNKDRRVEGLYYTGGGSHPGGGTPTVLISARITSELILRHETS